MNRPRVNLGDAYICQSCGEPQTATRTDAECMDEALDMYPADQLAEGIAVICEDCYQWIIAQAKKHAPHMLRNPEDPPL